VRVDAFDFELPETLIALRPAEPRESARLLVVGEGLEDRRIADLPDLLRPDDLLVLNDTRVIPARLEGRRGEARIEVTLIEPVDALAWRCFARPARRLKPGDRVVFAPDFTATVEARGEGGEVRLVFEVEGAAFDAALERHGKMPLPPYIASRRPPDARDRTDYQTSYAAQPGAVAAPTAGLHLTPALLSRLPRPVTVTLHVGAGTFLPVTAGDTEDHRMWSERGEVGEAAAAAIASAKADGRRIVAVGTTALRLLEASGGAPFRGETNLFITPGYRFRVVDVLLTNFHLPRSTLFMLVSAFCGLNRMHAAYRHAIEAGYRFYSYGDACLLTRRDDDLAL
jgi:S-adenosylmethionine:tRNA ribosyltransferase-isomerase